MNDIVKNEAMTSGCHHVGLSVCNLEESARFFTELLGWQEVRRDDDYPAIFVSDGTIMVTLWKSRTDNPTGFDKNNIGLHHVAFMVESEDILNDCYHRILHGRLEIEFAPEQLRDGPAKHIICNEPSGIRVELIWPGK